MISLLGSALSGIASGEARASSAAADLSRAPEAGSGGPDVASDFVTLSTGRDQVAIAAKVAKVDQEDQKALLDIVA